MLTALRAQFEAQRTEILNNLANDRPRKAYAKKDKRDWLAALIAWAIYTDQLQKAIAPILYAIVNETGKDGMSQVGRQPSTFDPTTKAVTDFVAQRSGRIATDVNAETEKQLRASLGQGVDNNETDAQLRARVEGVMGAALTYRADRISRTEITRAQGFADVEAWKQSRIVSGKAWYTIIDERTCPACMSMDGVIVALDTDFASIGDVIASTPIVYDTLGEPPLHVNCRCSLEPVLINLSTGDEA
jgi:SPP1 gp7 family putative phage head morphogenesis protein